MTNYYCYNLSSLQIIFLPQFDEFSWFEYKCFPHTYIQTIALFASWGKLFSLSFLYFSLKLTERFFFFLLINWLKDWGLQKGMCWLLYLYKRKRKVSEFAKPFLYIEEKEEQRDLFTNLQSVLFLVLNLWLTMNRGSPIVRFFHYSFYLFIYSRISARTIGETTPYFGCMCLPSHSWWDHQLIITRDFLSSKYGPPSNMNINCLVSVFEKKQG